MPKKEAELRINLYADGQVLIQGTEKAQAWCVKHNLGMQVRVTNPTGGVPQVKADSAAARVVIDPPPATL